MIVTTLSPSVIAMYGGLPLETPRKEGVASYALPEETIAFGILAVMPSM